MFVKIPQGELFLTRDQVGELEAHVLDGVDRHEFARRIHGDRPWIDMWDVVTKQVHDRITAHLQREARVHWPKVRERYAEFDLDGSEAVVHVFDVLHAYGLAVGAATIRPRSRSVVEELHNRACVGQPWGNLLGAEADVGIDVRARNRLARKLQQSHDCVITIAAKDVTHIAGKVRRFTVSLRGIILKFDAAVSFDLSPGGLT